MSRLKDFFKKSKSRVIFSAFTLCALCAVPTLAVVITTAHQTLSIDTSYNGKDMNTYVKQDLEGLQAYCLEPNKGNPVDLDYPENGVTDDGLYKLLKYGWPYIEYTTDPDTNYYISQLAVWQYLGYYDVDQATMRVNNDVQCTGRKWTNAGSDYQGGLTNDYVKACVKDLLTVANTYSDTQTGDIAVNPRTSVSKLDGDYLLSESHTIQAQGSFVNGGSLKLELNKDVPGLKIIKDGNWYNPNEITVAVGDTLQLAVPKYTPSDSVSVKLTGTAVKKISVFYDSPRDDIQDIAIFRERNVDASYMDAFNFQWTKAEVNGTLRVKKQDKETKAMLAGAVFGLFKDGNKIAEATSGSDGIAIFSKVPVGNYILKEITPPTNYVLSTEEVPVEIVDGTADLTLDFTIENVPIKHSVVLTKKDAETKEVIAGAQFAIFQGDKLVDQQETDENGQIRFTNLTKGDYTIKEIVPPVGFMPSDEVINVSIGDQTAPQEFVYDFEDQPIKFTIGVYKRKSLEDVPLSGAKFRLISNGRIVYFPKPAEAEIDSSLEQDSSNDKVTDIGQEQSEDNAVEKKETPTEDSTQSEDKDNSDNNSEAVDVPEIAFSDELTPDQFKSDLEDENAPEGMTSVFTTDDLGLIKFPAKLRFADFELVEIAPPSGYKPLEDTIKFTITPDTELGDDLNNLYYEVTVENEIGEGELELTKKDVSTGELLPNAKFMIYAEDGKTVVAKGVTDSNGIAKFKLETGKYFYQEYEAPSGYQIDNSLFPFEIKEHGDIIKCEMTNTKLPKTGAVPTAFPIIGAIALVACSGGFIVYKKRK